MPIPFHTVATKMFPKASAVSCVVSARYDVLVKGSILLPSPSPQKPEKVALFLCSRASVRYPMCLQEISVVHCKAGQTCNITWETLHMGYPHPQIYGWTAKAESYIQICGGSRLAMMQSHCLIYVRCQARTE